MCRPPAAVDAPVERERLERLRALANSHGATVAAFLWGLAEATFFFVIPDVLFTFTGIFAPAAAVRQSLWLVAGTVVGGAVMFRWGSVDAAAARRFLTRIPGISTGMVSRASRATEGRGLWAMVGQSWSFIPYKVFAVNAGALGTDLWAFLALTVPVRLGRVLVTALLAAAVGHWEREGVERHTTRWLTAIAVLWVLVYATYAWMLSGG